MEIVKELKNQQESLLTSAEERFKNLLIEVMNMANMDLDKEKTEPTNDSEINILKQEIRKLQLKL